MHAPCSSQKTPIPCTARSEARHTSTARASPTRSRRIGRSSHSVETKPPLRPLGPCPPPRPAPGRRGAILIVVLALLALFAVIALTFGSMITGTVAWGEHSSTSAIGLPVQQLESLLREATPGELYFTRPVYDELAALGVKAQLIGGADVAVEVDARRAIDQGTRFAADL